MSRFCFTKSYRMIAGLLTGLMFAILAIPLTAQPAQPHPFYDVTKEVTLSGTVSSVQRGPSPRTMMGAHVLVTTASGAVDADLGRWGLHGKGSLPVAAGQQVEMTGVMKTLNNKKIFVVRSVKAGGQVYKMRNEHGIPISPQSRERASQKTAPKGESL